MFPFTQARETVSFRSPVSAVEERLLVHAWIASCALDLRACRLDDDRPRQRGV